MMAEIVFWSSVALVLYAYLGYPSALMVLSRMRNRPVRKGTMSPRVSFIIAARNEEGRIREKIENTLRQDYPIERLEIIVASDCSTDRTDEIVSSYSNRVRLVRAPERRGKEAAQQLAVEAASGEILVFSDVATALAPDGISNIVKNFADPTVGCVSSVDRFIDPDGKISGEGAYVRYEMFLRTLETRVNSLVGLSGSFFAARREVCRNWAADRQSDFNTLLNGVKIGLRGVVDLESAGYYKNIVDDTREFQRKVRTVVRGIYVLAANVRMLNPVRYGLFSWQLLSHKVCRWLVPFFMILACLSNAILISHSALYLAAFLMQLGFYAAALGGIWTGFRVLRIPSFLLLANLAILMAWFRYARGERITSWTPSERMRALPQTSSR
jgi:cellulose synthase/poly-beta-1,6-N-acetylglucosamine synthase-like glycosyltransferase